MDNVRWGVSLGIRFAAVYTIVGGAVIVAKGGVSPSDRPSVVWVVLTYFILGIAGGAIVGALKPLTRWKTGATLVGAIVGAVVMLGTGPVLLGMATRADAAGWIALPIGGTFFGSFVGLSFRLRFGPPDSM